MSITHPVLQDAPVRVVPEPGKGRGVQAVRDIKAGEIIEAAPVIIVPADKRSPLADTMIDRYWFDWGDDDPPDGALPLGIVALINHSYEPNAVIEEDHERGMLVVSALRDIKAGEMLSVNYNGEPEDLDPAWEWDASDENGTSAV